MSNLSPDGEHRLKRDALKHFQIKYSEPPPSDVDNLIRRFRSDLESVRTFADEIDKAVTTSGASHDRTKLRNELQRAILEKTIPYNKDELCLLLTIFATDSLIERYI